MGLFALASSVALVGVQARAATAPTDLASLSIEQLGDIEVTSVSKRPESIGQAPSAIYVITHADIVRSGAGSIPEILRLAPNLSVYQTGSSGYVITARGMNGAPAAQNFSNKLLVMIDGRSVYSPLYSGVYWDMQDVLPEDIDRIEVISGPGATLWGANAVNGVVNIVTRKSADTQGAVLSAAAGDQERSASLRYGGRLSDDLTYRIYAKAFRDDAARTAAGASAHDGWSKPQAGFRLDWTPSPADTLTLQGDAYHGDEDQAGAAATRINGEDLSGRWNRTFSGGSSLQVQAYYDHAERGDNVGGAGFWIDTYNLDIQHSLTLGSRHEIVWGGGYRASRYDITGTAALQFVPAARTLDLGNAFVQDSITLNAQTKLILGAKIEDDPYVKPEILPNARLSWSPNSGATVWAAVSRAVRSPTPFDRDVVENLGGAPFLVGGADFQPEKLTAYELGGRFQPSARASFSVSTYYNVYDDLRSLEITPVTLLPLHWGNRIEGHTYGLEAWGDYQLTGWWRLSAAINYLDEKLKAKPGTFQILDVSQAGDDPKYQAQLRSSMNLGSAWTLDGTLRYVSALPDPRLPAYAELNGRLGWAVTDHLQLSLSGRNLLHDHHIEYIQGAEIPRSVYAELQWRF